MEKILSEKNNVWESYKWMTPEFTVAPTDGKTVKIRGKAIPKETISRNNKKYVDEELRKGARTFIDVPITENHKAWNIKTNQLGKVNWMEYDDGSMEYVAEVWNPEMAAELRAYAKNPATSKIRGVSVEADFLKIACVKCGHQFISEKDWRSHMEAVEGVRDLPLEPHGIRGRALSIVTGRESPGVVGCTLEVMETLNPLLQLLETVIKLKMEQEKMDVNTQVKTGPPYQVKEQTPQTKPTIKEYADMDACMADGNSKEECMKLLKEEPTEKDAKSEDESDFAETKITLEKLPIKEEAGKFDFDACLASGKSEEECAAMAKEKRETKEYKQAVTSKLNETIDNLTKLSEKLDTAIKEYRFGGNSVNKAQLMHWQENKTAITQLKETLQTIPKDDTSWNERIDTMQKTIENRLTTVASEIVDVTNKWNSEVAKLNEAIASIKPFDDTPLKEQIAAIKPYDDSALKTMVETSSKTITETLAQTTQKLSTLETEHKTVKEMYEKNLAAYEKDIKEYYKPLEQRAKELATANQLKDIELKETKNALQETVVKKENAEDKLTPSFKGHSKVTVKAPASATSFNPYDPSNK